MTRLACQRATFCLTLDNANQSHPGSVIRTHSHPRSNGLGAVMYNLHLYCTMLYNICPKGSLIMEW